LLSSVILDIVFSSVYRVVTFYLSLLVVLQCDFELSLNSPVYLSHFIRDYLQARTLRSPEQLLLTVPRMTLTLSAKAFSVSVPSLQCGIH